MCESFIYILKKILLVALTIILTSQITFATENIKKIDIKQAIEIAKQNNLDIQASKIDVDIAKNEIKKANRMPKCRKNKNNSDSLNDAKKQKYAGLNSGYNWGIYKI